MARGRRGRLAAVAAGAALLAVGAGAAWDRADERVAGGGMLRSASEDAGGTAVATAAAAAQVDAVAATAGGAASGGGGPTMPVPPLPEGLGDDEVIRTANLEVEVADGGFATAFAEVATIAGTNGGFVASSSSSRGRDDDGHPSAGSAVVRVPAANFDAARRQLIDLGELRSERLQGQDVAAQLTDLGARLRNLRSHEDALRLLMTKAVNVGETIEVQRQLSTVREQIEQLAAEEARLSDAVALSTITLVLAEPGAAFGPKDDPSPLRAAWSRAVEGAEDVFAGVLVGLGYLFPLALLAGAALLVSRPFVHRRAAHPVEAVASTPSP